MTQHPNPTIWQGSALAMARKLWEDNQKPTLHCIITSPPYYGLRDYGTNPEIWDEDPGCDHEWRAFVRPGQSGGTKSAKVQTKGTENFQIVPDKEQATCAKCGAWRGELGQEPTPQLFIKHLVSIFEALKPSLHDSGVVWVNLGDSYNSQGGHSTDENHAGGIRAGRANNKQRQMNKGANVEGLKPKDLMGIPWMFAFAMREAGWYLRSEIIWCLSGGTEVYVRSQKGDMPMTIKDMVRLDPSTLKLWNGEKWTEVLGWSKSRRQGTELELVLRSGERIACTPTHQFPTQRGLVAAAELQIGDVIQTTYLPEPEIPLAPDHLDLDAAWFAGLYVAEGSRSGETIQISGHTKEVVRWERLRRIVESYGGSQSLYTVDNTAHMHIRSKMLAAVLDQLVTGRVAQDKGFNPIVWRYSNNWLEELLHGYLDGDGGYDVDNNRWRLGFTRNYNLERDLRVLCARLGFQLTLNLATVKYQGRDVPTFRGEIRFERNNHHNVKDRAEVVEIRKARCRYVYDIGVADEPHLFALASGVLTHNSKRNPMPESVTDRPTKSHETIFLFSKSEQYFFDHIAAREGSVSGPADVRKMVEGLKRLSAKHLDSTDPKLAASALTNIGQKRAVGTPGGRNMRSVQWDDDNGAIVAWLLEQPEFQSLLDRMGVTPDIFDIPTAPYRGAHFATWPPRLAQRMIQAGTSEKGVCPACLTPWRRVLADGLTAHDGTTATAYAEGTTSNRLAKLRQAARERGEEYSSERETVGWEPGCECEPDSYPKTAERPEHDAQRRLHANLKAARANGATHSQEFQPPETVGWEPDCVCADTTLEPGDLDIINTPTGERAGDDPSLTTGRAGMNRPRGENEGTSAMTRFQQRAYARQLKDSPHQEAMRAAAGSAFDHYLRTDTAGGRPIPPDLLNEWIAKEWLTPVAAPTVTPLEPIPATVLDPFTGSGTTLMVARQLGRASLGFELNPKYVALAHDRLLLPFVWGDEETDKSKTDLSDLPLFAGL